MNNEGDLNKSVITFLSAKGGCGQTLLSSNFAQILSQNHPTLFIQLTKYPDFHTFVNIPNEKHYGHVVDFLENDENPITTFTSLTYKVNNLAVLLSPNNIKISNNVTTQHITHLIKAALNIYKYIVIDATIDFPQLESIINYTDKLIIVSNPDPQSAEKSNLLISNLETISKQTKKYLIVNQVPSSLSKKQLQNVFKKQIAYTLPYDNESAWDNIALGVPFSMSKSKLTKKLTEITSKIV